MNIWKIKMLKNETKIGYSLALLDIAKGFNVSVDKLISQNDNIYLQPEQLIVYKYK